MTSPGENLKDKLTEILFKAKGKNCTDEILAIFKSELKSLAEGLETKPEQCHQDGENCWNVACGDTERGYNQAITEVKTAIEKKAEGL